MSDCNRSCNYHSPAIVPILGKPDIPGRLGQRIDDYMDSAFLRILSHLRGSSSGLRLTRFHSRFTDTGCHPVPMGKVFSSAHQDDRESHSTPDYQLFINQSR